MTQTDNDPALDLRRLPFELERRGVTYGPGLWNRFEATEMVFLDGPEGAELCRVPNYRLISVSMAMLVELVETRAANTSEADQVKAALRDGHVECPPDTDLVFITVAPGLRLVVHRGMVVPGWPEDDIPEEIPSAPPQD